jgi:hypothetical protein
MAAADARCGLFAPEISAALAAGAAQARGAALRSGASSETLRALERTAQAKAAGARCSSPDIATAAARVKAAFAGYSRITRLTYTGDVASWQADRDVGRALRWRLAQETGFGPDRMTFGIAGAENGSALLAVARFADDAEPYAARIVMRDDVRAPQPYLDRWGGGATSSLPLVRRMPPASGLKTFAAQARAPAGADLLPKGARGGWTFRFPEAAAAELAGLDPREAIAVEFLFPNDQVRRAYVEVGDFAAGRAFLRMAAR